jgi:hypothetical protein
MRIGYALLDQISQDLQMTVSCGSDMRSSVLSLPRLGPPFLDQIFQNLATAGLGGFIRGQAQEFGAQNLRRRRALVEEITRHVEMAVSGDVAENAAAAFLELYLTRLDEISQHRQVAVHRGRVDKPVVLVVRIGTAFFDQIFHDLQLADPGGPP